MTESSPLPLPLRAQKVSKNYEKRVTLDGVTPLADFTRVSYLQPHWNRRKDILLQHPSISSLMQPNPYTALLVLKNLALLTLLAWMVSDSSFLTIFILAYVAGAVLCHAQWVLIHEFTHDLVFRSRFMNTVFLLFANVTHVMPSAVSFRYHHRMHHGHMGEPDKDTDLPLPMEDKLFGRTVIGRATWLSLYGFMVCFRSLKTYQPFEWATVFNLALNVAYSYYMFVFVSPLAFLFVLVSSMMSVGFFLHPLGVRWLAEHFVVYPLQETYSYYGSINLLAYNVGHHNEHHDFTGVPWNKLPKVREIAPEFYNSLYYHMSYFQLLWYYLTNTTFNLKSRVVRTSNNTRALSCKE